MKARSCPISRTIAPILFIECSPNRIEGQVLKVYGGIILAYLDSQKRLVI